MSSNGSNKLLIIAPIVFLALLLVAVLIYATFKDDDKEPIPSDSNLLLPNQDENEDEYDHKDNKRRSFCPCTGVVLDAKTGKPITGAQVMAKGSFSGGLGIELATQDKYEFAQTDEDGRYLIPKMRYSGIAFNSSHIEFVVYKAGYVAYSNRKTFGVKYKRPDFRYKNNKVMLEKWDDKKFTPKDHVEHVKMIGCDSFRDYFSPKSERAEKLRKHKVYCREAREEMILACKEMFKEFPSTSNNCEYLMDRDLGLVKKGSKKK